MSSNISLDSTYSVVFYVEQILNEPSPQRNNSPDILNSTERSEHHATRMPSISTIASPQPYIFTINDDSNEPTIAYGFGRLLPIVPPSLNDLSLPPNLFNILAKMAIATNTGDANDDNYSPQSLEPSDPSPISTRPMNVSAFNSWETSYTTTDNKRRLSLRISLPNEGGLSQHMCEACGQMIPSAKDTPGPSNRD